MCASLPQHLSQQQKASRYGKRKVFFMLSSGASHAHNIFNRSNGTGYEAIRHTYRYRGTSNQTSEIKSVDFCTAFVSDCNMHRYDSIRTAIRSMPFSYDMQCHYTHFKTVLLFMKLKRCGKMKKREHEIPSQANENTTRNACSQLSKKFFPFSKFSVIRYFPAPYSVIHSK